ncbi:YfhO family protein [Butyricicoccus faecihominis]|uniref:YfhO family protein n=1 Tax=Butyricicoccus faecihominis TaxID=1712515 RepID=UPI00247986D0|nr:YfhO family protein [Butyricicoccus faecihominis]MCQ5128028.1 YfhO family protein [Butyricicoccus faecihominis]
MHYKNSAPAIGKNAVFRHKIRSVCITLLIVLLFLTVSCIPFVNNRYVAGLGGDVAGYHFSPFAFAAQSLRGSGELPLWNPYYWGGISGFHNLTAPFYPIIYLLLPFFPAEYGGVSFAIREAAIILHVWLLQIGLYALCRGCGCRRISAIAGACACGIGGGILSLTAWSSLLFALSYASPLLASAVYLAKDRVPVFSWRSILTGVILAFMLLSGLAQGPVLVVLLWAVLYFTYLWVNRRQRATMVRITLKFLLAGCVGVGLAALSLFPTLVQTGINSRFVNDIGILRPGEPLPFWAFIKDLAQSGELRNVNVSYFGTLAVGLCGVFFSILGFFAKYAEPAPPTAQGAERNDPTLSGLPPCPLTRVECYEKRVGLIFGKVTVAIALLGSFAVGFHDIFYYIPFVNQIREPFLFGFTLFIGIGVLGGLGLDALLDAANKPKMPLKETFYNVPLLVAVEGVVLISVLLPNRIEKYNAVGVLLILLMLATLKWLSAYRRTAAVTVTVALVLTLTAQNALAFRAGFSSETFLTSEEATERMQRILAQDNRLFEAVGNSNAKAPVRITTWGATQVLPTDSSAYLSFSNIVDYWNPIYMKTTDVHSSLQMDKRIALQNIEYWFLPADESSEYVENLGCKYLTTVDGIYPDFDSDETLSVKIYETPSLGPAWLVYDFLEYPDGFGPQETLTLLSDPAFDVAATALIDESTGKQIEADTGSALEEIRAPENPSYVEVLEYKHNTICYRTQSDQTGLVVITESDAPGWKATVDGVETDILTVDFDRKGVLVGPGEHEIELIYRPDSFVAGLAVTGLTVAILVGYAGWRVVLLLRVKKTVKEVLEKSSEAN